MIVKRIGICVLTGALLLLCACDASRRPADMGNLPALRPPSFTDAPTSEESQAPRSSEPEVPASASQETTSSEESPAEPPPDPGQDMRAKIEAEQPDRQAVWAFEANQQIALVPCERECDIGIQKFLTIFYNASGSRMDYAKNPQEYQLEKLVDGQWENVPANRDISSNFRSMDCVKPYKIQFKYYDLTIWQADWMSAGDFRITQECRREDETCNLTFYFSLNGEGNPWTDILHETESKTLKPYHQLEAVFPLTAFDITQLTMGDYRISLYALGENNPLLLFHFSLEKAIPEVVIDYYICG